MSINIKKEEAIGSVKTVEEFEKVLGIFKEKYPAKYAIREKAGEFLKFRRTLIGYDINTDLEVIEQRKAEAEAKAKADKEAKEKAKAEAEAKVKADKEAKK